MSAKNLVHRSSKKRYKIPTEIVESFILVKKGRSQKPESEWHFSTMELDWRETQLHFTERKKKKREGITNRPSLFNHRTEPVVFSLPRGDRLISPEIVSRKGMRGNKVTERWIADRSSPERKRARTDWPRRGYLPL